MKNIIVQRREDICKNVYIQINDLVGSGLIQIDGVCSFPIELFNLKAEVENNEAKLIGHRKGTYCFPLRNKLIEVIIVDRVNSIPGNIENARLSANAKSFYIPRL